MASLSDLEAQEVAKVRDIFQQWDSDGNGTIERQELADVLFKLTTNLSQEDVDKLMKQIDTDGNGVIDFDEFLSWLTDPTSKQTIGSDGWLEDLNLKEVFTPLFRVFDRRGTGVISWEDFAECTTIIHNSIAMHAACKDIPDSNILSCDIPRGGDSVRFEDFVKAHVAILKESGIPTSQLKQVVAELAESMELVFDIQRKRTQGLTTNQTLPALQLAVEKLSDNAAKLYTSKAHLLRDSRAEEQAQIGAKPVSVWHDPPREAIAVLIRTCAKSQGLQLPVFKDGDADQEELEVTRISSGRRRSSRSSGQSKLPVMIGSLRCIVPKVNTSHTTTWYAEVARLDAAEDTFFYYQLTRVGNAYARCTKQDAARGATFKCDLLEDKAAFSEALGALPKELQLFAILKGQSLYDRALGQSLDWKGVESALSLAATLQIIGHKQVKAYKKDMLKSVIAAMHERKEIHELREMGVDVSDAAEEHLEQLQLTPVDVLYGLFNLGLLAMTDSSWSQILNGTRLKRVK
eukprot:TRINITY_DN78088_c0_g1_i1.p1 TRINITY_DN78088_c0_g1~~TRINITY_DN78088_c0_g1_i1.p1  ORF type:complete len:541 (+),score=107.99 TRINITY_DN78088_c0_g1_i1:72-1625(+)